MAPKRKRFFIDITPEIINRSIVKDSSHCVIADAVREQLPNAVRVSVDLQTIRWTDTRAGLRYVALTPATGQKVLVEFDQEIKPDPFTMRIEPFQIVPSGRTSKPRAVTEGKVTTAGHGGVGTSAPFVEGGSLPPTAALSNTRGRRRVFGIRLLEK